MIDKKVKKLNLGCGLDYKEGWINVDFNREVKADVYCDFDTEKLPFKDNSIDYVYMNHTLEHSKNVVRVIDELWRICKKGAIVKIYVPHYTGTQALKYLFHYNYFGIDTFLTFLKDPNLCGERYSKSRFIILKEELHLFGGGKSYTRFFNLFNFLFNFNHLWKIFMEKLWLFGFEEIYYKLGVVKSPKKQRN